MADLRRKLEEVVQEDEDEQGRALGRGLLSSCAHGTCTSRRSAKRSSHFRSASGTTSRRARRSSGRRPKTCPKSPCPRPLLVSRSRRRPLIRQIPAQDQGLTCRACMLADRRATPSSSTRPSFSSTPATVTHGTSTSTNTSDRTRTRRAPPAAGTTNAGTLIRGSRTPPRRGCASPRRLVHLVHLRLRLCLRLRPPPPRLALSVVCPHLRRSSPRRRATARSPRHLRRPHRLPSRRIWASRSAATARQSGTTRSPWTAAASLRLPPRRRRCPLPMRSPPHRRGSSAPPGSSASFSSTPSITSASSPSQCPSSPSESMLDASAEGRFGASTLENLDYNYFLSR
jgi:hypothetical protein